MIQKNFFGKTLKQEQIYEYVIFNDKIQLNILDYGAIIRKLIYKGKDIVLGYDHLQDYEDNIHYFGASIGRCANRIENGKFELDGKNYDLDQNNSINHLHGGANAIHKQVWSLESLTQEKLILKRIQKSEDDNYPGDLTIYAKFILEGDSLIINYEYSNNENSIADLTSHSYFNLDAKGDIRMHKVYLNSSLVNNINELMIPTGEVTNTVGTAFDFTHFQNIGDMLEKNKSELESPRGYDHNFIIDMKNKNIKNIEDRFGNISSFEYKNQDLQLNSVISNADDSLSLAVYSNTPCFQLYTGNFVENVKGKNGNIYNKHAGLCIEPQLVPNSINMPAFSSPKIEKDKRYNRFIAYRFFEK